MTKTPLRRIIPAIDESGANNHRVYGRRLGRPLRGARMEAIDELLPRLQIPLESATEKATLDPTTLFSAPYKELWFEIGFGNGEHLAALMERAPENAFIGAEPFINGMSAFLKDIHHKPHNNLRVWMEDALQIADSLIDGCIDGIYVLNPDPWPKARHHKRRIISQTNLTKFARIMKPVSTLTMATDVDDLADWMREQSLAHPSFKCVLDTRETPSDWIPTRYEQKGARAGRRQTYMVFERKA
ncbi:MAG: tRNA (guanine(46)-N(7))-methyltransferase TrmB [Alphaproteobacteria bacterium]|nr:tRNA (guanine(46)-N(7))-methyltransferase TrmB [Alphaproteobacteria bacterium]